MHFFSERGLLGVFLIKKVLRFENVQHVTFKAHVGLISVPLLDHKVDTISINLSPKLSPHGP